MEHGCAPVASNVGERKRPTRKHWRGKAWSIAICLPWCNAILSWYRLLVKHNRTCADSQLHFLAPTAKIIVVGSTGSGKSCLLLRFTSDTFNIEHETTIGVYFCARTIETKGNKLRLHVWDTAGQESFQSIARSYYRDAAAAILVYDVSSRPSFEQLPRWLDAVREYTGNKELTLTLVGNKIDKPRAVSREEAEAFARRNNLIFYEASAKTGESVTNAFVATASAVLRKIDQGLLVVDEPSSGVKHTERRAATPMVIPIMEPSRSWCCTG